VRSLPPAPGFHLARVRIPPSRTQGLGPIGLLRGPDLPFKIGALKRLGACSDREAGWGGLLFQRQL
jgi:hypothetical protein